MATILRLSISARLRRSCVGFAAICALLAGTIIHAQEAQVAAKAASTVATVAELSIPSGKAAMKGAIYLAKGAQPHATVILLHGFPGNEKNLDLAQALQRAGMNVVFFTYRGAWGSEGEFSVANTFEDLAAVKSFLQTDSVAAQYRVDPKRLSLLGHSFGGFVGIKGMEAHPDLTCVAALAPANVGLMATAALSDAAVAAEFEQFMRAPDSIKWVAASATQPLLDKAKSFDLNTMSAGLKDRPVLIIGASNDVATPLDQHVTPLISNWKAAEVKNLTWTVFLSDHAFTDRRTALSRLVVSWFRKQCYQVAG